jgi:hypothetical protein
MSEMTTVQPSRQVPLVPADVGQSGGADLPVLPHDVFPEEWYGPYNGQLPAFLKAQRALIKEV